MTVVAQLAALRDAGHLTDLDVHLADLLARLSGGEVPELSLAAALVSHRTGEGHVCADLTAAAGRPLVDAAADAPVAPDLASWTAALRATPVVGTAEDDTPLVLDAAGRLYLRRYWAYERTLADDLAARAVAQPADVDEARLRAAAATVLPRAPGAAGTDWQRVAAVTAVLRRLCVISGGPGTGKTSTVVRLLGLLAAAARAPSRVVLAAPTGKAAARLQAAVRAGRAALPLPDDLQSAIPDQASTVHRLLGARLDSPAVSHDARNPLAADLVVVDEASMVDLALMAKLVRALRPEARLVLLGDKDQLASVEAGAVLGDVCGPAPGFSPEFAARVARVTGESLPPDAGGGASALRDAVVLLRDSRRFPASSGIARLAGAVNRGDAEGALAVLAAGHDDVGWRPLGTGGWRNAFVATAVEGFAPYLERVRAGAAAEAVFAAFAGFRVLCAHRQGAAGVERVNRLLEDALATHRLIRPRGPWYPGRPVMVTRNDYALRIFNGDVGIVHPDPDAPGGVQVVFEGPDGSPRPVAPARLPSHETVFAMTVHKSQGSEFDRVLLLLPPEPSRVVTRELLYTAITRARTRVDVWASEAALRAAVARRIERSSGLRDALWG